MPQRRPPRGHHAGLSVHDISTRTDRYVRMLHLSVVAECDEPAPMKVLTTPDGQAVDLRRDRAVTRAGVV